MVNIEETTMTCFNRIILELKRVWQDSPPLTAVTVLMIGVFAASVAGIALDPRTITGVPAWLKPAKFAISTAIFCGTMAWLFRYINIWPKFVRAMGWILAAVLVLEVAIIDIQAARGTTSHFNVGTVLDGVLFSVMGSSIAILWLASIGVLLALFRQRFEDTAWGWWLRMGMLITVLGSAAGGLMVRPTSTQLEKLQSHQPVSVVGAHTVGAPDGGPGVSGLGWSTEHGDLRIPHFFGLHGIQILPFVGWLMLRRRRYAIDGRDASIAAAAGIGYIGFVAILTWQALRGISIVSLDGLTMTALVIWTAVSAGIFFLLPGNPDHAKDAFTRSTI